MSVSWRVPTRALLASLAFLAPLTVGASAASAAIVINEVESNAPAGGSDWVELLNTGNAAVAIGDYSLRDSGNNNNNRTLIPLGTTLNPGQYLSFDVNGLGNADSARLFDAADPNTPISTVTWSREAAATIGRCPDGTGETTTTLAATRDLSNSGGCAVTSAWPGSPTITEASVQGIFGPNMSGLVYQASGTAAPGVLWAVQNGPSRLYRLIFDGTRWVNDTANGWASGKQLLFPDGTGVPDAEGVTLAAGDTNGIFVSIERDDSGANANTSRPSVLRYDTSSAGAVLTATREWPLAADLPGLDPNAGLEAVSWVPDSYLVAKGFKDESTGTTYNPATYAGHGTGIFFVGVEQTGQVIGYALNQNTNAATRVATISGVYPAVMDLSWDAEKQALWAVCDDGCSGRSATLEIAPSGSFVVTARYDRPTGMPDLNNEGFAIAPQAECVGGLKSVFWADDSATNGHAIRSGKLNCTAASAPTPTPTPTPAPGANPTPTPAPGVNPTPAPGTNPTPTPVPGTNQTPTVPGTGTPNVFKPVLSALKKSAKASKTGTLKLKISCVIAGTGASSPTSCEGSVKLSAKIGGKKKTLGSASFKLAGGKQKELSVKLNAATRTALRRGALKATVSSTVGKQTATKALTLNRVR